MSTFRRSDRRGSAFVTTLVFCLILLALVASVLRYAVSERRTNNRAKLLLEARAAAEAISEYGIAQVKKILEANRNFTDSTWSSADESLFVTGGSYAGQIAMPPTDWWGGGHIVTTGTSEQPLMHVGKILQTAGGGLYFIDPTNPDNDSDPLKGKKAFRYDLDILSRATARDAYAGGGNVTKYMKQTFSIRAVPLFAHAVYYNMDLEVWPAPVMIVTGSTHTNQRLFARPASSNDLTFAGPVTAVKGIWPKYTSMPWHQYVNDTGTTLTNNTAGCVYFLPAASATAKPLRLASATTGYSPNLAFNTWVESTWNLTGANYTAHLATTETAATKEKYANWTAQTFKGNVLTHVNGLSATNLQGIPDYSYTYGSAYPVPPYLSTNDPTNRARALIERPFATGETGYVAAEEAIKYSRTAALYIVANTTSAAATGHKPDGTTITVAARSYRAFMHDTTTTPSTITEVLLPGQNTYGWDSGTSLPIANPHVAHRNARPVIQLFDVDLNPASATFNQELAAPRRMVDMRRTGVADADLATATTTFNHAAARAAANTYIPKNLFMIDVDMMELKKAVKTIAVTTGTSSASTAEFFATGIPDDSGTASDNWDNHIYRANPTAIAVTLSDATRIITTNSTLTNAFNSTIWNGAVYIESLAADYAATSGTDAEKRAKSHNNHNSGVRLINGRGKVASIGSQGFTLATNDAVYILGTFNADGLSTTPATVSVTVPPSVGASTGHNYETGELPASVVADAVTLLSQPLLSGSGAAIGQSSGWNDKFSSWRCDGPASSAWVAAWATTAPSGTNARDGIGAGGSQYPYRVPYDASNGSFTAVQNTTQKKLVPPFSEYSVALLMGLVPTGKNGVSQNSGGLHNFPRFLEDWSGVDCRIRGSMVALFECRVATEPWSLRVYAPPNRIWGFNLLYDSGVMPPLTPKTIHFRRSGANDITKADYNAKLTAWGYSTL